MPQKNLKKTLYASIIFLSLIFLSGFIPIKQIFFLPLALYIISGITLIIQTKKSKLYEKLNMFLNLTGYSSVVFSISLIAAVFAVKGFYSYPEVIFYITVIGSLILFIISAIGSVIHINKRNNKK